MDIVLAELQGEELLIHTYARCRYKNHQKFFRFTLIKLKEYVFFFISETKCEEIKHKGQIIFCSLRENARKRTISICSSKNITYTYSKKYLRI